MTLYLYGKTYCGSCKADTIQKLSQLSITEGIACICQSCGESNIAREVSDLYALAKEIEA